MFYTLGENSFFVLVALLAVLDDSSAPGDDLPVVVRGVGVPVGVPVGVGFGVGDPSAVGVEVPAVDVGGPFADVDLSAAVLAVGGVLVAVGADVDGRSVVDVELPAAVGGPFAVGADVGEPSVVGVLRLKYHANLLARAVNDRPAWNGFDFVTEKIDRFPLIQFFSTTNYLESIVKS